MSLSYSQERASARSSKYYHKIIISVGRTSIAPTRALSGVYKLRDPECDSSRSPFPHPVEIETGDNDRVILILPNLNQIRKSIECEYIGGDCEPH